MRVRGSGGYWLLSFVLAYGCGSDAGSPAKTCMPGSTQLCYGPAACPGAQQCMADGISYSPCDCGASAGSGGAAGSSVDANPDAGAPASDRGGMSSAAGGQAGSGAGGTSSVGVAGTADSAGGEGGSPPTFTLDWARAVTTGANPQQLAADPAGGFHISGALSTADFGNGQVHGTWFAIDRRADGSHVAARTLDAMNAPATYRAVSVGAGGSFVSVGGIDSYYDDLTYDTNELRISSYGGWVRSFGANKLTNYSQSSFALAVSPAGEALYSSTVIVPFDGTTSTSTALFDAQGKTAWTSLETPLSGVFLSSGNFLTMGTLSGSHDFGGGALTGSTYFVERDTAGNHVASWATGVVFGSQFQLLGPYRPRLRATPSYAVVEGTVYQGAFPAKLGDYDLTLSETSGWLTVSLDAAGHYHYAGVWPSVQSDSNAVLTPNIHAATDALGRTFICGHFWRQFTGFGHTFTATGTSDKDSDIVIAALDVDGTVRFAKAFGASGPDTCADIAIDAQGGVLVTGQYQTSLDFGGGPLSAQPRAATDPPMFYIARFKFDQ
jgi:hypothetical protein